MMPRETARTGSQPAEDGKKFDATFVIQSLKRGGAQRVVSLVANAWARQGYRVSVVTFDEPDEDEFELAGNVVRHCLQTRTREQGLGARVKSNFEELLALRKALKDMNPQTVISFIYSTNVRTIIAAAGLPIRVVISERNDPARQQVPTIWSVLRRRLYRFADAVTANSHGALSTLKAYVPEAKLAYVPNPVNEPSAAAGAKAASYPFILNVGRLHEQKAQDVLLEAFAEFVKGHPAWRLCIIGDGPLREDLKHHAQGLGIASRIDWVPYVKDPSDYYRTARIFALPSRYEGVPNALLEAMSSGLPSIVTETCPGSLEFVDHEQSGLVIPADDRKALAQAFARLASDEEFRTKLGKSGKKRVSDLGLANVLATWNEVAGLRKDDRIWCEEGLPL